uniref:Uncharacterized protein n=1 Tax=Panagrolaimus sp. PS1159 TaxID=55785 RepID=A0AC35EYL2_9BILA
MVSAISDPTSVGHILQVAASAPIVRGDGFTANAGDVCDGGGTSCAAEARGDGNASSGAQVRGGAGISSESFKW